MKHYEWKTGRWGRQMNLCPAADYPQAQKYTRPPHREEASLPTICRRFSRRSIASMNFKGSTLDASCARSSLLDHRAILKNISTAILLALRRGATICRYQDNLYACGAAFPRRVRSLIAALDPLLRAASTAARNVPQKTWPTVDRQC